MPKKDQQQYENEFWGKAAARAEKRRRNPLSFVVGFTFLALLIFGTFAFTGYLVASKMFDADLPRGGKDGLAEAAAANPETVLLIGVDRREPEEPARSDTIMLAVLDPGQPQVDVLSIPRDTRVKIPGRGYDKINAAHAYGGPKLLLDTVNYLLGSHVTKYVELDFQGFEKIIDTLGGIEIDVDKRMDYPEEGIDLYAGLQRLNGYDALGFVRFRNDPGADITRIGRQQKFIQALVDQALKLSTVPKIPQLVTEISRYVDTNLSVKEMLSLALSMKDLNSSSINTYLLPGEGQYINDINYWVIDQKKLAETLAAVPNLR